MPSQPIWSPQHNVLPKATKTATPEATEAAPTHGYEPRRAAMASGVQEDLAARRRLANTPGPPVDHEQQSQGLRKATQGETSGYHPNC